ncbi:MAG: SIS domain-containing protein [Siphonobacter aquaeclarae]|jgi:D-sedoheptulose 7-phosphate isomerase|nr:SIS domain-containing protein [Siphonobacter aquaeclarae]
MQHYLSAYLRQQKAALDSISVEQVETIIRKFKKCWEEDRQVFVFGNGGSASNASHFVTDLGKSASDRMGRRFRVSSLNESISWITALGNDYAYDEVYRMQLHNYARPGDLVMMLSVSGSSPNLVKAAEWSRENGVETIALVGGKGGTLAEICDTVVRIADTHYGRAEDAQMAICHLICYAFIEGEVG